MVLRYVSHCDSMLHECWLHDEESKPAAALIKLILGEFFMSAIQGNNLYMNHPIYTNSTHSTNLGSSLLTDEEAALANAYKNYLDWGQLACQELRAERNSGIAVSDELRKYFEMAKAGAFDCVMDLMNTYSTCPITGLTITHIGKQPYNLPEQGFRLDAERNAMYIGVGTRFVVRNDPKYDDVFLSIDDCSVGQTRYDQTDIKYALALDALIKGIMSGNANWGNNAKMNDDIIAMLNRIGLDTGREFYVNDVSLSVNGGILQTNGNAQNSNPFGTPYLNALLTKAYEQNMIYVG